MSIPKFMRKYVPAKCYWPQWLLVKKNMQEFKRRHGYEFDIKHPKTFNEKIQYYKLFYRDKTIARVIDKYNFKEYIREKLGDGYTVPLIAGPWNNIHDVKKAWASLPEEFVLKSTISSGGYNIKVIHNKNATNEEEVFEEVKKWFSAKKTMKNNFSVNYYKAVPRVFAEEYMESMNGQLADYKFFCFNGEPYYVYTAVDHFQGEISKITFYDLDWNQLDVKYGDHENLAIEKPVHFEEMLDVSKKLSADFPFVRVDFYDMKEHLYVGELTFSPGLGFNPYHPMEFDEKMGELFTYYGQKQ